MHKLFWASVSLVALAACGGGSTGGGVDSNGISTKAISGPEIEQALADVASAAGTNLDLFSGADVSSEGGLASAIEGLQSAAFDQDLENLTPRDLTAPGSATYTGVVVLLDIDASDVFVDDVEEGGPIEQVVMEQDIPDPTFALLGRSEMTVAFGADPTVSGGANGFIGLNIKNLLTTSFEDVDLSQEPDVAEIISILPTVDVAGSLTYSGGEIISLDPESDSADEQALDFNVDGNLQLTNALTGNGASNVQIDGRGRAGVAGSLGIGLMDLNTEDQVLGGVAIGVSD